MLDDLACSVSDDRLVDCSSNQGTFNCDHRSDAGVICVPAYTTGPGECNKKKYTTYVQMVHMAYNKVSNCSDQI